MNINIESSYFVDGKERIFIPYKGWNLIKSDGTLQKDELTTMNEGPLKIIPDPLGHGNWHTLENLLSSDGNKVLNKGVRFIKYQSDGYYFVRDNNEDELINRGDVRGGFKTSDFVEKTNIISEEGILLSNTWFDSINLLINGYFLVTNNGLSNLMDIKGNMLLKNSEINLLNFIGGNAYSYHDGKLFSNNSKGRKVIKQLELIDKECRYTIFALRIPIYENETGNEILDYLKSTPNDEDVLFEIQRESDGCMNLIDINGYVLFDRWLNKIHTTTIKGVYFSLDSGKWNLIDIAGNILNTKNLGQPITRFKRNHVLVRNQDGYGIVNTQGKLLFSGFTSAMWTDSGIWNINVESNDKRYYGLHGDGNNITSYIHELLISNRGEFILEKDDIWYLVKSNGELEPVIKAKPSEVTNKLRLKY